MMATDETFRVWIGCLACYNDGRLTGAWYDAAGAGEVTTRALHAREGIVTDDAGYVAGQELYGPHEELWCLDIMNAPAGHAREMSPDEAQRIAEKLEELASELDDADAAAFAAWCAEMSEDILSADVDTFRDAYVGTFESFREYADECADEEIGARFGELPSLPYVPGNRDESPAEWVASHFDYAGYARDLEMYHTTAAAPDYRVYVFRSV